MLVLSRRADQEVRFPELNIRVRVLKAQGTVKLGIDAPADVRILRDEVNDPPPKGKSASSKSGSARHEMRNRLQTISLGLHLLQQQLDQGLQAESEQTMDMLLGHVRTAAEPVANGSDKKRRTALIVEDEPNERMLLAGLLRMQGIDVETASNGQEAISHLAQHRFDVVLLDLNLPDMRGETILSRIRLQPEFERLPVYVVSGADESPIHGEDGYPHQFFQKPLNPQSLIDALNVETCA